MIGAKDVELNLPTSEWRAVAGPRELTGLELLVVGLAIDGVPEVLLAADQIRLPVIVVVDELRPWALSDLFFHYPCIRNLITLDELEKFDLRGAIADVRQSAEPGRGELIGSVWSLPANPDDYEARRFLSLNSRSTAPFLSDLRAILSQMHRDRPDLPFDPSDSLPPAAVDKDGHLKGAGVANLSDLVEHAREEVVRNALAPTDMKNWTSLPPPLLLLGDSGTGKSLLTKLIHDVLTPRETHDGRRAALVEVAVAGMDVRNFDYDMFGATSGVWNDVRYRVGDITQAAHGTLFLDEIGDMPLSAQTRLLRFFNDLRIKIPGTSQAFFSYQQIVAATNRDLDHLISLGRFRNDLRARFRARITLPPISARQPEERRQLVDFVAQHPHVNPVIDADGDEPSRRLVSHIEPEAMEALVAHDYHDGNFRELEQLVHNGIQRARDANRRTLLRGDLDFEPAKHRRDSESRTVEVQHIPETDRISAVKNKDELLRLADTLDRVVLKRGTDLAVIAAGVTYTAVDDAP